MSNSGTPNHAALTKGMRRGRGRKGSRDLKTADAPDLGKETPGKKAVGGGAPSDTAFQTEPATEAKPSDSSCKGLGLPEPEPVARGPEVTIHMRGVKGGLRAS